jgi:hypothetical protein
MTVEEALASGAQDAPDALRERMLAAVGASASEPEDRTAEICISAAAAVLQALLDERRYSRDSAIDLLTADALMTYAFEHASRTASVDRLAALCRHAEMEIGRTAAA